MANKTLKYIIPVLALIIQGIIASAQKAGAKEHRILVILNGSASMGSNWQAGKTRFEAGSDLITSFVEAMYGHNSESEIGMRVYGHQFNAADRQCNDSRREVPFTKDNLAQVSLRLIDLSTKGNGSLSYAINQALKKDMTDTNYLYSIIVVTDSVKNCPGDYCMVDDEKAYAGLYKRYRISLTGADQSNCYDRIFAVTDKEKMAAAVKRIVADFPEKRGPIVINDDPKPAPKPKQIIPVSTKPKEIAKTSTPPPAKAADTVLAVKPQEEAVVISKNSRIKSKIDEFGEMNLLNIYGIPMIVIYRAEKEGFEQVSEIFSVGLRNYRAKLKTGVYKAVYSLAPGYEGQTVFSIEKDKTTEVYLR